MILIYYIIFFSACFLYPSVRTYLKTGINPITFKNTQSAHDLIGWYMKLLIVSCLISGIINLDNISLSLRTFHFFSWQKNLGMTLMLGSAFWVMVAQFQMSDSWRIGIDEQHETALVTSGLFSISRNPIFLGMLVSLLGVTFYEFHLLNLFNFIFSFILITIQVRLEEHFMKSTQKNGYEAYLNKTPRWILLKF